MEDAGGGQKYHETITLLARDIFCTLLITFANILPMDQTVGLSDSVPEFYKKKSADDNKR